MPDFSKLEAHVMWRETNTRMDVLVERVREGTDVSAASEFCRWLRFSGVLKLLEGCPDDPLLRCRGRELADKVQRLASDCGEWFARHERANFKPHPQVPRSELEAIREQLRNMNAQIAELGGHTAANNSEGFIPDVPGLKIITGGKL